MAEGVEVAKAFVTVVPVMPGMQKEITKAFGGATQAAQKAGSVTGSSFSAGFGTKMGAVAGVASTAASTVINAFSGLSGEILNASDSTQKFQQTLGFAKVSDGDIKRLTASTQDYANKTVYGIDDIRNTTAQLAANGVPNYDKLAEAAGNLNAVAGGNAETYKSVAMMLTQTAGAGKLTTENWNQLADAIPGASGKLQEAMRANGAYTGNFRDAMADGQITAGEFNQALMQLGMDDVAQKAAESTSTFEGAFGNLQATITDGAANIVNTVKPYITGFVTDLGNGIGTAMQWVNDFMDVLLKSQGVQTFANGVQSIAGAIGAIVTPFAGLVGSMLGFIGGADSAGGAAQRFSDILGIAGGVLQSVGTFIQQNTQWLLPLVAAIMGGVTAFQLWNGAISLWQTATTIATGVQAAFNMVMSANPIMLVVTAIGALAAALVYFFTQTETGRQIWASFTTWLGQAWQGLVTTAQTVWGGLSAFFTGLWTSITTTVQTVWNGIGTFLSGVWTTITGGLTAAWNGITGFLSGVWNGISGVASTVFGGIRDFIVNAFKVVGALIVAPLQGIQNVINTVFTWVLNFIRDRMNSTSGIWKTAWTAIYTLVSTVWKLISGAVSTAINAVRTVVVTVVKLLQGDWRGAWDTIKEFVSGIWDGIETVVSNAIDAVRTVIGNVMDAVKGAWERVWDAVSSFLGPIWDGIGNTVSNAIDAVKNTVSNVLDGIRDVWDNIWGGIRDALGGVWDGITSAVGNGIQNVANTVGGIKDTVLGAVSGAGEWLYDAGQQIINGLIDGIGGAFGWLKDKISSLGSSVVGWAEDVLGIHSPSRVFRDRIGAQLLPGMQQGIERSAPGFRSGLRESMTGIVDEARASLNAAGRQAADRVATQFRDAVGSMSLRIGGELADRVGVRLNATGDEFVGRLSSRVTGITEDAMSRMLSASMRMQSASEETTAAGYRTADMIEQAVERALRRLPVVTTYTDTRQAAIALAPDMNRRLGELMERE